LKVCSWRCFVAVTLMGRGGGVSPLASGIEASIVASDGAASIELVPPVPPSVGGSLVPPAPPLEPLDPVVGEPPWPVVVVVAAPVVAGVTLVPPAPDGSPVGDAESAQASTVENAMQAKIGRTRTMQA
jgi:hypothetical protein